MEGRASKELPYVLHVYWRIDVLSKGKVLALFMLEASSKSAAHGMRGLQITSDSQMVRGIEIANIANRSLLVRYAACLTENRHVSNIPATWHKDVKHTHTHIHTPR